MLGLIKHVHGEERMTLDQHLVDRLINLPVSESKIIQEWVIYLRDEIKAGRQPFNVISPFVDGLAARGEASAAQLLGELMLADDLYLTEDLAESLGEMGKAAEPAVPYLVTLLQKGNGEWSRAKAAWALGEIGELNSVGVLIEALSDEASSVRVNAVNALRSLHWKAASSVVMKLLEQDEDYLVRAMAALALGEWKELEVAPLIEKYLSVETNPTLIKAYEESLGLLRE